MTTLMRWVLAGFMGAMALGFGAVAEELPEEWKAKTSIALYDLGPYKATVTRWTKFEIGDFYTITSPELKGMTASGFEMPSTMCDYLHLLELRDIGSDEFAGIMTLQEADAMTAKVTAVRTAQVGADTWYYLKVSEYIDDKEPPSDYVLERRKQREGAEFEASEATFPELADIAVGDSVEIAFIPVPDSRRQVVTGIIEYDPEYMGDTKMDVYATMLNNTPCY